ncbi:MAG: tetraacyldisaccharide 4'-kinase, partial [Deltaproteobacteria bacterium]|nr:tetraacyldisaccharide 4'-kinase [Deltaproteobacteria bacterium]
EPYLLARRLKGVPVVVGKDRCKSGLYAIKAFSPDVILLDDGFQHIRLERDVNLLLVDSKEGFGNGHLLPRGLLREPISGIKRADAALVKGGGLKTEDINRLKSYGLEPITFRYKASRLVSLKDSSITGPASIKGKRVLAVAGIASPGPFFQMLEAMGAVLPATLVYPDHHSYTGKDIEEIKRIKDSSGAELIVTTEKDGVKLEAFSSGKDGLALYALGIEVMTDDELLIKKIL